MIAPYLWLLLFADHYTKAIDTIQVGTWGADHIVERELVIDSDVGIDLASIQIPTSLRRTLTAFTAELRVDGKVNPAGAPRLFVQSTGTLSDRSVYRIQVPGLKTGATLWYRYELQITHPRFLSGLIWDHVVPIDYREIVVESEDVDRVEFLTATDSAWVDRRELCPGRYQLCLVGSQVAATPEPATVSLYSSGMVDVASFIDAQCVFDDPVSLTSTAQTDNPTVAAFAYVQNQVRYESVLLGDHDYRPDEPSVVLERRFGDCKDKAMLLAQLIRNSGHQAYLTLAGPADIQHDYSLLSRFNHMLVALPGSDGWLFLDPTVTDLPFGSLPAPLIGGLGLVILDNGTSEWARFDCQPQDRINLKAQQHATGWRVELSFSGSALASFAPESAEKKDLIEALQKWLTPELANQIDLQSVVANWRDGHVTLAGTTISAPSPYLRVTPFRVESWYDNPTQESWVPLDISVSFSDSLDVSAQSLMIDEPGLNVALTVNQAQRDFQSSITWPTQQSDLSQDAQSKLATMYQFLIRPIRSGGLGRP